MNKFYLLVFTIFSFLSFAQKKQCFCAESPEMNDATTSCETKVLNNGAKLYWQYNCEKIWLTLENENKKIQIDQIDLSDYGITYRLGFHFIKEYKNSILFRTGCGATGPCSYVLIDKYSGKKLKKFNQLIDIDTDVKMENPHPYSFPFVIYLSPDSDHLILYFVDTQKIIQLPLKEKIGFIIPENHFSEMRVKDNLFYLTFTNGNEVKKKLKFKLRK